MAIFDSAIFDSVIFDTGSGGGGSSVSPSGIASGESFGSTTVTYQKVVSVSASGISSQESFGTAVISSATPGQIICTGIASNETFGTSVVSFRKALEVSSIASSEQFGITTLIRYPIIVSDILQQRNTLRQFIGRR